MGERSALLRRSASGVAGVVLAFAAITAPSAVRAAADGPAPGDPHELERWLLADDVDWHARAQEVAEQVRPSVVAVFHPTEPWGASSGWLISPTEVVTARHVASDGDGNPVTRIVVGFDGQQRTATTVAVAEGLDVGLFELDAPLDLPTLEWGDENDLEPGDPLLVIGHPNVASGLGGWLTVAGTYVATVDGELQADIATDAGGSGGPLVDLDGRVVAISCCGYHYDFTGRGHGLVPAEFEVRTTAVWDRPQYSGGPAASRARGLVEGWRS